MLCKKLRIFSGRDLFVLVPGDVFCKYGERRRTTDNQVINTRDWYEFKFHFEKKKCVCVEEGGCSVMQIHKTFIFESSPSLSFRPAHLAAPPRPSPASRWRARAEPNARQCSCASAAQRFLPSARNAGNAHRGEVIGLGCAVPPSLDNMEHIVSGLCPARR